MLIEIKGEAGPDAKTILSTMQQRWPDGAMYSTTRTHKREGWCLETMLYVFPDGLVRTQLAMLDSDCKATLRPLVPIEPGGDAIVLQHASVAGGRPIAITARWLEPQSPEMIRMREHAKNAPLPEPARLIDQAWQRARGDAPPAPPAPPPAAASAAMPAPPLPPAAPRPQAVLPAPPAAHPALPPAVVAPAPERAAPALPAVPAAGASAPIRVELALEFEERRGEHKQTLKTRPTLLLRPGGTGTIRLDVGDKPAPGSEAEQEQLEVSLNLRQLDNEQVLIEAQLRLLKSGELIAKPRLVTRNGVKARIETGREGVPGQSDRHIRLDVLPTVLAGQAPPP